MPKSNTEIHVYINENDSVVDQLQKSVTELTKLLEGVQDDSMVISIERVKREKCK